MGDRYCPVCIVRYVFYNMLAEQYKTTLMDSSGVQLYKKYGSNVKVISVKNCQTNYGCIFKIFCSVIVPSF